MTPNPLTQAVKKMVAKSNDHRLFLHVSPGAGHPLRREFELTCAKDDTSYRETVKVQGEIVSYKGHVPANGFWSLYATPTLLGVMELLPDDAEIEFRVSTDAGTTQNMEAAGLHGDYLWLMVNWKRRGQTRRRQFLLDVDTAAQNTARFGVSP